MGIVIRLDTEVFDDKNFGNIKFVDSYLEYLQGDGNSYINTGFSGYRAVWQDVAGTIPDEIPSIEITFATDVQTEEVLFGLINNPYPTCRIYTNIYQGNYEGVINVSGKGAVGAFSVESLATKKVFKYGSVYSYVDGVQVGDNSNMANQYRLNAYEESFILFGSKNGDSMSYSNAKIYEFKAFIGEEMVLHLKPYADENGIVCMKDVLTGTLYYNQGTGTFTGGKKI